MPRHPRFDAPDLWHHVMNRGIARRTLFESRRDIRAFLARLALEVRAGRIRVHAYCVVSTHFHLLVQSPVGELSAVMQRIQNEYARWFNRSRQRDGPLYRARFRSKPVHGETYRRTLVRYIDANAVQAGLAVRPEDYPYGSAQAYARPERPIWLERSWVEKSVRSATGNSVYEPEAYSRVFPVLGDAGLTGLVERRLAHPHVLDDPLEDLLGGAGPAVLAWMERKAALADGTAIGIPLCDAASVLAEVERAQVRGAEWRIGNPHRPFDGWLLAKAALLRELTGLTLMQTGARIGRTANGVQHMLLQHQILIQAGGEYPHRVAELAHAALQRCHATGRAEAIERGNRFAPVTP